MGHKPQGDTHYHNILVLSVGVALASYLHVGHET